MLAPLPSIEAFRRDTISIDGAELDDGTAASWLESAIRLERAAMSRGAERERFLSGLLAQHDVMMFPDSPVSPEAVVALVMQLARTMEEQTCLRTAHSVLATLLIILPESEVLLRGRVIAKQARLARDLGERAAAARYYEEVVALGTEHALPELVGRGWVGLGMLARLRGDFPEARRQFHAVLELKGVALESIQHAHHELMVAAASASDYDTAASHAWQAFEGASTQFEETDALLNLAQLLLDAGHARAALRGFSAALARKPICQHELPILGGASCAAAASLPRAAARAIVRNFADRVEELVARLGAGRSLAFQSANALVEMSEALTVVGEEERALQIADKADALASAHGFHQLTYRLENPVLIAAPVPIAPATQAIIEAVDELEGAELVAAG